MSTVKLAVWILFSAAFSAIATGLWIKESVRQEVFVQANPYGLMTETTALVENQRTVAAFDFVAAAKRVTPAVVHIKTYYHLNPDGSFDSKSLRLDAFGSPIAATGSGVILTSDGYIVTNNHVVNSADKIEVITDDKRTFKARLIGYDTQTDLAMIKIEAENLPTVSFGSADQIQVGEWVVAVGNPFNLTSTVTAGIVSAKGRNINILNDNLAVESFIQTDAVVNPGNSGGALVDVEGKLIGINTAIATPTGAYAGYSFAVPAELVKKVMQDMIKYGEVQRGLLGINITDMTESFADDHNMVFTRGVYVSGMATKGAAKISGIKEGDVIIKIEDRLVENTSALQEIIARYRPGDTVKVSYVRIEDTLMANAILLNKQGTTELVSQKEASVKWKLGAELVSVSAEDQKKYHLKYGVMVENMVSGLLSEKGVAEGWVILSVNRVDITSVSQIESIFRNTDSGEDLVLECFYKGRKTYVTIRWR